MSSPLFLSSYVLYKAALTAFRDTPKSVRSDLSERDIMRAYKQAIADLPKRDESDFIDFAQRVLLVPKDVSHAIAELAEQQRKLDRDVITSGARLVDNGSLIRDIEFLHLTGMDKRLLVQRLASREIFEMPQDVHYLGGDSYIPAFFADLTYDSQSLYAVSRSLKACNGIQKFRFFTTPNEMLGNQSPLELIERKQLELIPSAVKAFRSNLRKQ